MTEIIHPATPQQWDEYYTLRYNVLRKPWNQPPGSEKDDKENESIHLLALVKGQPAGVCRIQYNSAEEAQIRFMGIDENFRGQKLGKVIMQRAEEIIRARGCTHITLQARSNAVDFYASCGFTVEEKTFLLWDTIQHYRMNKRLVP